MTTTRQATARALRLAVDAIKVGAGCSDCGYNTDPRALAFDHINPADKYRTKTGKLVHIADMVKGARYSVATVMAEIAKCRVMCHNCHAIHTYRVQRVG